MTWAVCDLVVYALKENFSIFLSLFDMNDR